MIRNGIIPEDSTIELLHGQLVYKDRSAPGESPMRHDPLHALSVGLLTALCNKIDQADCHTQIQLPVACSDRSEPEPDAAIVRGSPRDYIDRLPTAADVSCVIEVAYSSLRRDRTLKRSIYAAAGIGQYVLVNLQNRTLEVHTDPDTASSEYRTKSTLEPKQTLTLRLPEGIFECPAQEILP